MDQEHSTYLELADWRRRVADLYGAVRGLAASDPQAALMHWRGVREWLYREHPQSPVPASERAAFRAQHFPHDPVLRFEACVVLDGVGKEAAESPIAIPTSSGGAMDFRRVGWVEIPFPSGTRRLALSWMAGYAGGLFLSFRDATNGVETYGAGRYLLDVAKSADLGGDVAQGRLILDFNFAYHPSCAFDPRWACPLTPPENRLDLAIRAGERLV
jgi:uncharacterized protein (DUF1684 family)